jgi:putative transcriptional regulator
LTLSSSPCLEDLLEPKTPSAAERLDASLAEDGASDREIAETKAAVAALGQAALSSSPEAPSASIRDRILASSARPGKYGIFVDRIARLFDLSLEAATELMASLERPGTFMPFLVEGLELVAVPAGPKCAGAIATIVRIEPGVVFPEHTHRGEEITLLLDGGFREPGEGGAEVWRGDELYRADGSGHALVALPGVPCIAAVVIYGHGDFR